MTTQSVEQAALDGRLRRTFRDYIGAVYRIAFGRPGDHDVFRNAIVLWTDFIPPIVLLLALHLGYTIASTPAMQRVINLSPRATVIALSILGTGVALRLAVALAVTWGLGKLMTIPERILPGLLGYLWTQAALVAPGIMLIRTGVQPHDPWWSLTLSGVAAVFVAVWLPAKVMRVAFGFGGYGGAVLIALAGSTVSYAVDFLVGKFWF